MKLRNKKTGEIKECVVMPIDYSGYPNEYEEFKKGGSLAELNEEWEDYEGTKWYWYIDDAGVTKIDEIFSSEMNNMRKSIGNYFETKEEAEKAVEKLKAWKRLKDKGFRINSYAFDYLLYAHKDGTPVVKVICDFDCKTEEDKKDLDLLFGGEE